MPRVRQTIIINCFFFSSRRRHTRLTCDWSSDVCSSDLVPLARKLMAAGIDVLVEKPVAASVEDRDALVAATDEHPDRYVGTRSEERRVGKECRSRWARYH